ncbi:MAG: lysoplasmalogenase [Flavobacteriaceae bacterium]
MSQTAFKSFIFISALLAIIADFFEINLLFYFLKPLTTSLIILFLLKHRDTAAKAYSNLVIIGLLFCLGGDTFLLFPDFFVFGLGAFLIGHLWFIAAFVKENGWKFPLKIGIPIAVFGSVLYGLIYPNLGKLFLPVAVYMTVIVVMSWQGIVFTRNSTKIKFKGLSLAVSLFLFSDALIAFNKFYAPISFSGIIILTTYWMAIFLLAKSATNLEKI